MPKNKSKGSKIERELFQKFIEDGRYRVVRVAGSGLMENADCDLIAGKKGKKFAIEVKQKTCKVYFKRANKQFHSLLRNFQTQTCYCIEI